MLLKVKSIQTGKIVIEQAFPADVQLITIGRSPDCDVVISDSRISRRHLKIQKIGEAYFIEDTNSTNHTYINGKLINSNVKTKLSSGDKVRLANEDFTFSV